MCTKLAQNAVHGAMAGFTAFTTGIVNNAVTWIPIQTITDAGVNNISVYRRTWRRLISGMRMQPMINPEFEKQAQMQIEKAHKMKQDCLQSIIERVRREDEERHHLTAPFRV